MQPQHFGDTNDYQKLGVLRLLANDGQYKIGVCWMLTVDEGHTGGPCTHYLYQPEIWRNYDAALFDLLQQWVSTNQRRDVMVLPNTQVLPGAKFYSAVLTDSLRERQAYFRRLWAWLSACDLIFYDPDRGIETQSCPKGRLHSAKYLYWDELCATFAAGHSVLMAQRFRREERTTFVERMAQEYQARLCAKHIYWLRTQQLVYFLSAQETQNAYLAACIRAVETQWAGQIQVGSSLLLT